MQNENEKEKRKKEGGQARKTKWYPTQPIISSNVFRVVQQFHFPIHRYHCHVNNVFKIHTLEHTFGGDE